MSMKLSQFNGQPAIYVCWQSKQPKVGDHFSVYENDEPIPGKQPIARMILDKRIHSQQHQINKNFTEEWWDYHQVNEEEFYHLRSGAKQLENIAKNHESLF